MRKVIFTILLVLPLLISAQEKIYAPALTAPANAAIDQAANALLDWGAVSGALKYQVYIDSASDFSSAIVMLTPYTAINNTYLDFGTVYYWKVRSISGVDTSFWSAVRSFTTRTNVLITTPTDNKNGQPVNVKLQYTAIGGVSLYEYELDTSNLFSSSYYRAGVVTSATTVYRLDYGQKYYWRYRGMHPNDTSDWSVTFAFNTKDTVKLKLPVDAAVNVHPVDSLQFSSIIGSKWSDCEFDTDPGFGSPEQFVIDTTHFYLKPTGAAADTLVGTRLNNTLMYGTTYYWRARLRHPSDTSQWSDSFSFTTIGEVALEKPADDSIDAPTRPRFEWRAIRGALKYELQYDTSIVFLTPTSVMVTDSSYTISSNLQSQKDYYWRVRCLGLVDTTAWSDEYHFSTTWGVGIEDEAQASYSVYPNPTNGDLYINMIAKGNAYADVMNILGEQVIAGRTLVAGSNYIDLSQLRSGVYFLRVNIDGQSSTSRIVLR